MSKFEIRYDILPSGHAPKHGHGAFVGLTAVLGEMKPGGSIFVERPGQVKAKAFLLGAHKAFSYYLKRHNPLAKFSIRTVEENGKPGVRIFRLENRPEAE